MNAHVDVAAYALGAMDDREASQFEDHLVGCLGVDGDLDALRLRESVGRQVGRCLDRLLDEVLWDLHRRCIGGGGELEGFPTAGGGWGTHQRRDLGGSTAKT